MSANKGKHKSDGHKPSKADLLIEEAVRSVEARENEAASEGELAPSQSPPPKTSGPIAKIDVQQMIDKETYLRLAADFENFRKRAFKERSDAERAGREKILRGFLEIMDNIERGLQQAKSENSALAEGMRMVLSQAENWLRTEGLERVESVGKPFDPSAHEAVSQRSDPHSENGIVLEELKRGYRWSDRLLRPASVVVCKNSESEASSS